MGFIDFSVTTLNMLKSALNGSMSVKFSPNKIIFLSAGEVLLKIKGKKASETTFELSGRHYTIRNKGFFSPVTVIEKEDEPLLLLHRPFLGTKGHISFVDGPQYLCRFTNTPLVKLVFLTGNEKEIFRLSLKSDPHPVTDLLISDQPVPKDQLLLLIILGCFLFKGIIIEHHSSGQRPVSSLAG